MASAIYNESLSAVAIALTFIAFYPYIRSILQGKIKPHLFSWVIWGSTTFVVFLAQLEDGGGAGAWPIGVSGVITIGVAIMACWKRSDITITRTDWMFFLAALSSFPFWYFTSDPLWAVIILTTVDVFGFGPTVRKAYIYPFEEQLTLFCAFCRAQSCRYCGIGKLFTDHRFISGSHCNNLPAVGGNGNVSATRLPECATG